MKIRLTILLLMCSICFTLSAQGDSFQLSIIEYLNNNGTETQYKNAYEEMFEVLKKQFTVPEVPESVWTELKSDKQESLKEIIAFLTFAYRKHFTETEIEEMASFYKTAAAQKLVNRAQELSNEDNDQIMAFFNSDIGKKIEAKRPELSVDIAEISGHWSRELFAEKMGVLVKKGYSPEQ
ncbi:DUF2059 domain-containing protein [Ulvibacter antarcticus]|uniref:DUF2059 domain-containing protein n=1 Tax=Ulvibacter antarcticus TaxID=442714 RepID=A0A3L9YBJ0_9FLAO|nr:DUF2059 domain-containing protein [Ulvibacter antarcticus]RMA56720.1 hypothetical protein BXY75_3233 [Ulvibacter antarcticus]